MSDHKETKKVFRPVMVTEKKIVDDKLIGVPGYVYFTSDTHKIFLGEQDGSIKQMSESKGVFYGKKEIEEDNSGNTPNPIVEFSKEEIEGEKLPEVDDLILNIDGCFYRVTDVLDEFTVKTNRLTLQGTGIGGSGGGGGDATASLRITAVGGNIKYFSREAKKASISLIAYSSDAANYISTVECSYDKDFATLFATYNVSHPMEVAYEIDIIKEIATIESGKKIYVRVTDKYGGTRSLTYTINIVSLSLTTTQNELFSVTGDSTSYICSVGGTRDNSLIRTLHYDLQNESGSTIYSETKVLENNEASNIYKTINLTTVPHGAYTLKVYLIGIIAGVEIRSNELIHKLLRYRADVGQPIFTALIPEDIQQYTDFQIGYLLAYGDIAKQYNMDVKVDGISKTIQVITAGQLDYYVLNFDKQGAHELLLDIPDLGVSFTANLTVSAYTGSLPVINLDREDLMVYLNPKGRTNNAIDKEYWPDYKNNEMKAKLSNFYYRSVNGWMTDSNNIDYLKVSQGASVILDEYRPYRTNPKLTGLTIELDFKLSGVTDYNTPLISCIACDNLGDYKTGFIITGNSYDYYISGKKEVHLNLVEGERIKLSCVIEPSSAQEYPMCYTYLNGIISNAINYAQNADFTDDAKDNNLNYQGLLRIDSTAGQIDVYGVRFYATALDSVTVLNNYQATLDTLAMRQASYKQNLLRYDFKEDIDLEKLMAEDYPLQIPYIKIIGGFKADKEFTMKAAADDNVCALPAGKKDYRAINMEVVYPRTDQNPYFADYKNFTITTTFADSDATVLNGFGKTAKTGAIMYAQGTSSLEYPVKNLRVKLKGGEIKVRPDMAPVDLICFKADYMDSSGSHNTGGANFIDAVYENRGIQTPGQKEFGDNEKIVTCIKGHPCVIFWSKTGEKGSFEYIGKYNLNLDKATPEPFGFKISEKNEKFGYLLKEDGDFDLDASGNKQNSIYCFEFLDNGIKVCNFLPDDEAENNVELTTPADKYYDTWYSDRFNSKENEILPGWTIGFESRYPEDKIGKNDADVLYPVASWINELYNLRQADEATALQRFKDEYQEYFDRDFLITYYLITEVLLMIDSRVKNMMIATWGKEHRTFKTSSGETKNIYNYIWYPIFYDMDTMLGLDNTGISNKNYYDEDTKSNVYNGDCILWDFVRDALKEEIQKDYSIIESANDTFTKNYILPYFNSNQANMANETFYNEDAMYKYIDPFRNGYVDHLHDVTINPGGGDRLYAAQGDRSMERDYFLDNRLKFLRGKYSSTKYQGGDRIEFRLTYPKIGSTASGTEGEALDAEEIEKTNASIVAVPPSGNFEFTSFKTGYAGIKFGANGQVRNQRFVDEQTKVISEDTSSGNGTEMYLLGISNLSDVGDLSDKYLYNLIVKTSDENHLKRLKLGNHHKDYYNPYWKNVNNIGLSGFTYLEEFNLENCNAFKGIIDFRASQQIKKILLNGSSTSSIQLPPSGVISELRIPTTINSFAIDSHPTLISDNFTIGYYDYDTDTWVNDYTKLLHISIKNTPIDSYAIAHGAILEPEISRLATYCFQGIEWEITDPADVIIEDGAITGIKILDALDELKPYEGIASKAETLTGTLTINVGNYTINEYALYNKYNKIYPNLTLKFVSDKLQAAHWIKFYNSESILGEPYFKGQTDGTATLAEIMDGITQPIKQPTNEYTYTFTNKWYVRELESTSKVFVKDTLYPEDGKTFADYIPDTGVSFVPAFDEFDRYYTVTLYADDNGTYAIWDKTNLGTRCTAKRKYGNSDGRYTMLDILEGDEDIEANNSILNAYCYRPYDIEDSNPNNQYIFQGWQSEADHGTEVITWSTLEDISSSTYPGDFVAYAKYKIGDFRENPLNTKVFSWDGNSLVNSQGRLEGKICIPNPPKDHQDTKTCQHCYSKYITEVVFEKGSSYELIDIGAFAGCESLEGIILPESLKEIGSEAFSDCENLKSIDIPSTVITIGEDCFKKCSSLKEVTGLEGILSLGANTFGDCLALESITLPESLKVIPSKCFYHCEKLKMPQLPSSLTQIGANAFSKCESLGLTSLPKSLTTIDNYAFYLSGNGVQIVEFGGDIAEVDGAKLKEIGIKAFETSGTPRAFIELKNSISLEKLGKESFKDYAVSVTLPWTEEEFLEAGYSEGTIFGEGHEISFKLGGTA